MFTTGTLREFRCSFQPKKMIWHLCHPSCLSAKLRCLFPSLVPRNHVSLQMSDVSFCRWFPANTSQWKCQMSRSVALSPQTRFSAKLICLDLSLVPRKHMLEELYFHALEKCMQLHEQQIALEKVYERAFLSLVKSFHTIVLHWGIHTGTCLFIERTCAWKYQLVKVGKL